MEDFGSARALETADNKSSNFKLHAEWLDTERSRIELAHLKSGSDLPGPGKDVADRLDRELADFAGSKLENPSKHMQDFQKLVEKFGLAQDKKAAIKELGPEAAKLRVKMTNDASANFKEMQKEADKIPGRKELEREYSEKNQNFFGLASKLPSKEYERVLSLMEWKPGESRDEHSKRVADGLKNQNKLLKSFNEMDAAAQKIEDSKTERERELSALHRRDLQEAQTVRQIVRKMSIRSDIKA